MMKTMGMSSFSSSTFLFTPLHLASGGSSSRSSHAHIPKNTATIFLSSSLLPLSQSAHFPSLSVFPNIDSNRLRASAFNKGRKGGGGTTLFEMDGSDEDGDGDGDGDEFIDFDDEFDADDEDGDEAMFLPLGKMKKWLENKPRGFGERKVYDTFIEEKLLEEIEQSRQAQTVNVNNLKNNPVKPGSKKDDQQNKKAESVPIGIRVRVGNLPKKKNIHRDLKAAFDGVSGIINISPAVSGNKKTKDPVCKGFAFVEFKHEVDAIRFVQNFSGQNLTFGRIQKQIKCEMINSLSHSPAHEELWDNGSITDEVAISHFVDVPNANFDIKNSSSDLSLESVSDEVDDHDDELVSDEFDDLVDELVSDEFDDQDDEFDEIEVGEGRNNLNAISEAEAGTADIMEPRFKRAGADSIASTPLERIRALEQKLLARGKQQRVPKEQKGQKLERVKSNNKKKVVAKQNQQKVMKEQNVQKLDIPGSAKRLKIKEKTQLTGVFSKYGLKTPSNSKEEL